MAGSRPTTLKVPVSEEVAVRWAFVRRFLTVMLAPETTAPDVSTMAPDIWPVSTCAMVTTHTQGRISMAKVYTKYRKIVLRIDFLQRLRKNRKPCSGNFSIGCDVQCLSWA
jgi:hypothetical protein